MNNNELRSWLGICLNYSLSLKLSLHNSSQIYKADKVFLNLLQYSRDYLPLVYLSTSSLSNPVKSCHVRLPVPQQARNGQQFSYWSVNWKAAEIKHWNILELDDFGNLANMIIPKAPGSIDSGSGLLLFLALTRPRSDVSKELNGWL